MGKKKGKRRWTTNEMKGDLNEQALFSDSALEEMIRKQYGVRSGNAPMATKEASQRVIDEALMEVGVPRRQETPRNYQTPVETVAPAPKPVERPVYTEQPKAPVVNEKPEDANKGTTVTVTMSSESLPFVQDIERGGKLFIQVHDWAGNCLMIPYAKEGAEEFSVRNIPLVNDGRTDEEQIQGSLMSLAYGMASSHVLWGMPSLIMDKEEFHEETLHHDVDVIDMRYTTLCISDDAPEYVFGYMIPDRLIDEWIDIISDHMDDPDALILTLSTLQRQMHELRWINFKDMSGGLSCYMEELLDEKDITNFFEAIKNTMEYDEEGVLQNAEFLAPITTATDIDECMFYGLGTMFNIYRDPDEKYPADENYDDSEDATPEEENPYDQAPNGTEAAMTPEALAAWAAQYNSEHKIGGYVNPDAENAEREGASVDDASFPADTANTGADLSDSSAETDNVQVHNEHAVSDGTRNGYTDSSDDRNVSPVEGNREGAAEDDERSSSQSVRYQQDVVPAEEEVEKEREEERREESSEAHEVQKAETSEAKEEVDEDQMIIGVNRG
jgi:hypothetical protein